MKDVIEGCEHYDMVELLELRAQVRYWGEWTFGVNTQFEKYVKNNEKMEWKKG